MSLARDHTSLGFVLLLLLALLVVLVFTPRSAGAELTVYVGNGSMNGQMCPGGMGGCVEDEYDFSYSGPIRLEVTVEPLAPGDDDCTYGGDGVNDWYVATTIDPVTYTGPDGTTGLAYGRISIGNNVDFYGDPYNCWRPGSVALLSIVDGSVITSRSGYEGVPSPAFGCPLPTGGVVHPSTSEVTNGSYCMDAVLAPAPLFGASWDGVPLQELFDLVYGPGAIDVDRDYEGYRPGDGDPAWWQDDEMTTVLVREIAGYEDTNTLGWYVEDLAGMPVIDGVDDGVIFEGPALDGAEFLLQFDQPTRFGLYLNPNGPGDANNAPEPELFYTNRFYNDIGPDGSGALHTPEDGDLQALIFNITHLRDGVPTYVVAWEDLDAGALVTPTWSTTTTDNDFNDLVIEISAFSPVEIEGPTWGGLKVRYGRDD